MKIHQSLLIELRSFHANFQFGLILPTSISDPLHYHKKITLNLPIMNRNNQKVLPIAGFYLICHYNGNDFWRTHLKLHMSWVYKSQYGRFDKSSFFKTDLWNCLAFATCIFHNILAKLSETLDWHILETHWDYELKLSGTSYLIDMRDVTNSWLDDKLLLAGLWLFLVDVVLSKERIQNYFLP